MNTAARHRPIAAAAVVGVVLLLVGGCTRSVDDATPRPVSLAAPIPVGQVVDLLSPNVLGEDGNLFVTAEPEECRGLGQEVDPPFIDAHRPLATDGGHWTTSDGATFVEEMVAVYRSEFDSVKALDDVRRTIGSCKGTTVTITTMHDETYVFEVLLGPASPQGTVVWGLRASDWFCDNTFVAAHNAAVEITACGATGGYDVTSLAVEALARIEALANTTA